MITETAVNALIGLPIWWTGWQILDWAKRRVLGRLAVSEATRVTRHADYCDGDHQ